MADMNDNRIDGSFLATFYGGKSVLITGGLGFLGSSVANRLGGLGAEVVVLDSMHPLYGGNPVNIDASLQDQIRVVIGDVRNRELVDKLVRSADVIFHFAAQVSYIDSANIPFEDLDVNQMATLGILEACRHGNPRAKVIFSSSRLVLGETKSSPVLESHATDPLSIYGVHKLAAEKYHHVYYKNYGIPTTVLRITNPYGPRQQIKHSKYSLVGWFIRLAMENREITVFGDGCQVRNYIYIDDIVEAFVRCGATRATDGQLYLLGSKENTEFRTMVQHVVNVVGQGVIRFVPWPKDYEQVETGDVVIDTTKLRRAIDWEPQVTLQEGIARTFAYYSKYLDRYVPEEHAAVYP